MNKKRLLLLADHMETVEAAKYNQGTWAGELTPKALERIVGAETILDGSDEDGIVILPEGWCGTEACVLGHATTIPEIPLRIFIPGDMISEHDERHNDAPYDPEIAYQNNDGSIDFEMTGVMAASEAFDVSYEHSGVLFGGKNLLTYAFYSGRNPETIDVMSPVLRIWDITPVMVATALRKYVETAGKSLEDVRRAVRVGLSV